MIIKILQFLLSLSLIIVVHEFGHFIFAKIFKCRVEKFYLFFDWKFSLLKHKFGETTYGIGWIPLGGYVKIAGMVDESMDKKQLAEDKKPWEFRSKPAWQRLLIIVGGVLMNFVLAAVIYIALAWTYGESYISNKDVHSGYQFSQTAQTIGFEDGDKILTVDGQEIDNSAMLAQAILLGEQRNVVVERGGKEVVITISDSQVGELLKEGDFVVPRTPLVVGELSTSDNSELLKVGDSLMAINGVNMRFSDEFRAELQKHKGDSVTLSFMRGGEVMQGRAKVSGEGSLGFYTQPINIYPVTERSYSFFEAVPYGLNRGVEQIAGYFDQLGLIFSPETEAYKGVGGFITMGKIFPEQWNWMFFWNITALLSIMIGVLNIMPIPALDGGHLVFILYEMITGRAPSQKFMEGAQLVGFIIIIGVVILANGNDIIKLF